MTRTGHAVRRRTCRRTGMTALQARADDLAALRRCTQDGSLELLYQPEVDLATGAILAMEGLLRWHHTTTLFPGDFFDLAEGTGLSRSIGHWVLRTGAAEAATWQRLPGTARQLWLNASTGQLREPGFADRVAASVQEHRLPAGALGIEISEFTVRELGSDALALLNDVRQAGAALAVDDFASWYSSLGDMELLPLTAVKLGQQHVRDIDRFPERSVAATVIRAAHDRGLYVVAEGVESYGEAARLSDLGCDRAHGWLFASPVRADKARWLLTKGSGWRGRLVTPDVKASSLRR